MLDTKAVIIIDMLNDFVTGKLKIDRAQRVIPNIKRLIEAARTKNIPVIYVNDAHFPQDLEVTRKWGEHAIKGTKGAEVIPELQPAPKDYVLEKRTYSGFYETGLDPLLRSLNNGEGVKTVILCGLHTHICVRHTAADAFFRGYRIVIVKDGVEAFTDEDQAQGLKYLNQVYGAQILTTDEVIADF